jgi:hypothetical protein
MALVKLREPVNLKTDTERGEKRLADIICIPLPKDEVRLNQSLTIAGWGDRGRESKSTVPYESVIVPHIFDAHFVRCFCVCACP